MHALIYFVAAGEEEGEALATVEECVMKWMERGVDYYSMPDEGYFKKIWGERKVLTIDSEEGQKILKELIKENLKVLHEEFKKAKEAIDKGDFDDAHYHLRMASGHPFSMNAFIDAYEPLLSEKQIDRLCKNYCLNANCINSIKIWLVPVDIHY